ANIRGSERDIGDEQFLTGRRQLHEADVEAPQLMNPRGDELRGEAAEDAVVALGRVETDDLHRQRCRECANELVDLPRAIVAETGALARWRALEVAEQLLRRLPDEDNLGAKRIELGGAVADLCGDLAVRRLKNVEVE